MDDDAVLEPLFKLNGTLASGLAPDLIGARPGASLLIVLGLLVASGLLVWLLRRATAGAGEDVAGQLLRRTLPALREPLLLVLWAYGAYAALVPVAPLLTDGQSSPDWLASAARGADLIALLSVLWLMIRLVRRFDTWAQQWSAGRTRRLESLFLPLGASALRLVMPALALILILPLLPVSPRYERVVGDLAAITLIVLVVLLLLRAFNTTEQYIRRRYPLDVDNNLSARRVFTQFTVLKRLGQFVVVILGLASALMVFEPVRQLGAGILASAGVAGLVVGFAAQRVLANLLAGIQIALTQPIRLDDAVIVENEWGWVEELTLTYVVVRLWDWRRLVLPINYFIEKPFQNWTRSSAELIGSVFFYVDYAIPLAALREELSRVLGQTPLWDGKVKVLQVVDTTERTMVLRALASARNAPQLWDLRCFVREHLIDFIQREYPESLPRLRAQFDAPATDGSIPQAEPSTASRAKEPM